MAHEPFLINPPKRLLKVIKSKLKKENRMARRRKHKLPKGFGKKHRPVLYSTGPRKWNRSPFSRSRKSHIAINPFMSIAGANPRRGHKRRGRRLSRNPVMGGIMQAPKAIFSAGPFLLTGGLAGVAVAVVPGYVSQWTGDSAVAKYGTQFATLGVSYVAAGKFLGRDYAYAVLIGGGSIIAFDLLKTYVLKGFLGMSDYSLGEYSLSGNWDNLEPSGVDYPLGEEVGDDEMIDAFPSNLGAFVETPLNYQSFV